MSSCHPAAFVSPCATRRSPTTVGKACGSTRRPAARSPITDNTITGNYANGVYSAGSGTTVLATRNTVTLNSDFGFFNFNSTFYSGGDNRAMLNFAAPSSGTITVLGGL